MLINSLKSRRDDEEGFTLIELMVVVLIIAILIAIAIPTFLGARQRAQDRASQSDLRNGLTAEKVYYTDNEAYSALTADMVAIEPSLQWNSVTNVAVSGTANEVVKLTQTSKSGTVFCLGDIATSATGTAGTYYAKTAATCGTAVGAAGWSRAKW